jgi:hypothetical protein
MHELKITDDRERELILRSLITHAFKCKDTIKLHNETKIALGDAAIVHIAEQAKGGYPWTVIPVECRADYLSALESASAAQDIAPLSRFLSQLVEKTIEGKPEAH